jgi:3-oxoadipate enol-lactonase
MDHANIPVNGATLYAVAAGPAGAPAVIFMGSLASDTTSWGPQIEAMAAAGFRAISFDFRGHGGSSTAPPPFTLELFMEDLRAVCRHFGVTRPHLVGLSLGGMVAMHAAVHAGADYASIVVASAKAHMPEAAATAWAARATEVRRDGVGIVVAGSIERWFTEPFHHVRPDAVQAAREMIMRTDTAAYADCINIVRNVDLLRQLPTIRLPALYVVGEHDLAATPAEMRDMAERTPGARLEIIPAAAHMPAIEQPAAFNACLLGFFGK